jgi:Trypsin
VVHPKYEKGGNSHDVMVMKLATPSDKQYIKLNSDGGVPDSSQQSLTVMGYGDQDSSSTVKIPKILTVAELKYVPQSDCQSIMNIGSGMLCAASKGKDSCGGDSGGPLVIKGDSAATDLLVGTVSWGIGCAKEQYPGVYARTSTFYNWIVQQVCALSPKDVPQYIKCPALLDVVQFNTWKVDQGGKKLDHCQGDCDNDDDCQGDMVCFQRESSEWVPGCRLNKESLTQGQLQMGDVCINPSDK